MFVQEYYTFGESTWDLFIFIGTGDTQLGLVMVTLGDLRSVYGFEQSIRVHCVSCGLFASNCRAPELSPTLEPQNGIEGLP